VPPLVVAIPRFIQLHLLLLLRSCINLGIGASRGCRTCASIILTPRPVIKADGSITAWGDSSRGGSAPSGSGYTKPLPEGAVPP
jgi:hypothetical protein